MSTISIIGAGNMASAIGGLAVEAGHTVEIIGRDEGKAASLAKALGGGTTVGKFGDAPSGDIVILAVLADGAVPTVRAFGDTLAGKTIVDITNPFNATATGLTVDHSSSIAKQITEAVPASANVVKGFNTLFRHVLASGTPVDVFIAGDNAQGKAQVAELITSIGLRPRDVGDLDAAHWVEGAGLLTMGLAKYGVGGYDFALGVTTLG